MIRYREQRELLADSMATTKFFNDGDEVKAWIRADLASAGVDTNDIISEFYARDPRIDWPESWIVTITGYGVVGYTDGPIDPMRFDTDEAIVDEA